MLLSTGSLFGSGAPPAPPSGPTVTFIGRLDGGVTGGGIDPQTENVDVGAAGNKIVVVCAHSVRAAVGQRTIASISIDGTNGTIAGQTGINDGANEGTQTGIAYREIATGGSIPIVVDWSGLHSRSVMDVYTIAGYTSNAHVDVKTATGDDPTISTLTVSADGCVVAAASGVEPSTGAMSFSGVTLDAEGQASGTLAAMRTGSGHATGLGATAAYNVQETSSAGFEALVAASFV